MSQDTRSYRSHIKRVARHKTSRKTFQFRLCILRGSCHYIYFILYLVDAQNETFYYILYIIMSIRFSQKTVGSSYNFYSADLKLFLLIFKNDNLQKLFFSPSLSIDLFQNRSDKTRVSYEQCNIWLIWVPSKEWHFTPLSPYREESWNGLSQY